jgi:hypothetical protein
MSISERINPDNLNIHQFQEAPEGKPELPFDVERDLTLEDKLTFINKIKEATGLVLVHHLALFKMLWSNDELPVDSSIAMEVSNRISKGQWLNEWNLYIIHGLRVAYPEINLDISKAVWRGIEEYVESLNNDLKKFVLSASDYAVIKPENAITSTVLKSKPEITNLIQEKYNAGEWAEFASLTAHLRLLDESYNPQLDEADWKNLQETLRKLLDTQLPEHSFGMAKNLKILAAHSVKITSPGVIDIQMYPPEDLNQSAPAIPETRKF